MDSELGAVANISMANQVEGGLSQTIYASGLQATIIRALENRPPKIHCAWGRALRELQNLYQPEIGEFPRPERVLEILETAKKSHQEDLNYCEEYVVRQEQPLTHWEPFTARWLPHALCHLRGYEMEGPCSQYNWEPFLLERWKEDDSVTDFILIDYIKCKVEALDVAWREKRKLEQHEDRGSRYELVLEIKNTATLISKALRKALVFPENESPSRFMADHIEYLRSLGNAL